MCKIDSKTYIPTTSHNQSRDSKSMSKRNCDTNQPAAKRAHLPNAAPVGLLAQTDVVELAAPSVGVEASPTKPDVKLTANQQITQIWLAEPDAAAFVGESFVPDMQMVLQHIQTQRSGKVYTRLPRVLAAHGAVINAVLEVDASQIVNVLRQMRDWPRCDSRDWVRELVLRAALTKPKEVITWAPCVNHIFCYDEMLVQIVAQDGQAIQYIPEEKRTSQLVVLAMKTFSDAVKHAPGDMRAKIERMGDKFGQLVELLNTKHDASQAK